MSYSGEELLRMWRNGQEYFGRQLSQREMAVELGLNFDAMHGLLYRAQQAEDNLTDDGERIELVETGNTRVYAARGHNIQTLEDLIKVCEIDLEKWRVDRHVANAWEVTVKEGLTYTNFQVKAWLTNKFPEPLQPVISDVVIKNFGWSPEESVVSEVGKALILADPHFGFRKDVNTGKLVPFHDRDALSIALALAKELEPELIALLGDWLDFAEWSDKFIRSPDMYNTTQPALIEAAWFLGELRLLCPRAQIFLLEGNHEGRVTKAINKQVPYAYGITQPDTGLPILSVPNMLPLERLGIQYIGNYPDGEVWLSDNLRAIHGNVVRNKSGATATSILENITATTVFGHVHRQELASKTVFGRDGAEVISAFSPGCLCRVDGEVPAVHGRMNWQQGIGVIDYGQRVLGITPISITQGAALFEGRRYLGKEYIDQLKEDTNYAF